MKTPIFRSVVLSLLIVLLFLNILLCYSFLYEGMHQPRRMLLSKSNLHIDFDVKNTLDVTTTMKGSLATAATPDGIESLRAMPWSGANPIHNK